MMPDSINHPAYQDITIRKTLRDEFAMKILQAAANSGDPIDMRKGETEREALYRFWRGIAEGAYIAADAMMREREKRE